MNAATLVAAFLRCPEGIMLQRIGAGPIWIPVESVTEFRADHRADNESWVAAA